MANPKGHEPSLVKFKPKWKHGATTVIRVPLALSDQILDYAHRLDVKDVPQLPLQVNRLTREQLETEALLLCKKKYLPQNWRSFIDRVLELQG